MTETTGMPTAAKGALKGVIILDLTRVVAGPYCAMLLADMGATVIKIEHPKDPDLTREFPPALGGDDEAVSGFFAQYNRNKMAISLDLKAKEGRELFFDMVRKAHIVIENFRPGTMDKLGLSYQTLKEINPAIVMTSISGFGQSGPNAPRPATTARRKAPFAAAAARSPAARRARQSGGSSARSSGARRAAARSVRRASAATAAS